LKTEFNIEWAEKFRRQPDECCRWPSLYTFKFILPKEQEAHLKGLFPFHDSIDKPSRNNRFLGVACQMMMPSAEAVIKVYRDAAQVKEIIAL